MSAEESDPELDALIWCAAFAPEGATVAQSRFNGAWCIYEGVSVRSGQPRLWEARNSRVLVVTESVDAALLLVPTDWWLHHACEDRTSMSFKGDRHTPKGTFSASLQHVNGGRLRTVLARTLPLALCAAACLARCPPQS
jgi:hypothetical protein